MRKFTMAGLFLGLLTASLTASAEVFVDGYYRDDGTYVRPHIRSSPDNSRANNYGPSQNSYQLMNPQTRDYDGDGIPNYYDRDFDNDGIGDNFDYNPYGR